MRLANTAAPSGVGVPPARPAVLYTESNEPTPVTQGSKFPLILQGGSEPTPQPFRSSGSPNREARRSTAFYSDTLQGWSLHSGDVANGLHAVIARQTSGMPLGEQEAWPTARPATLFRAPQPWDRGTARATPNAGA